MRLLGVGGGRGGKIRIFGLIGSGRVLCGVS
jgi:hypothetical protein